MPVPAELSRTEGVRWAQQQSLAGLAGRTAGDRLAGTRANVHHGFCGLLSLTLSRETHDA